MQGGCIRLAQDFWRGVIPDTSIPYWDDRCGLFFTEKKNFISILEKKYNSYQTYTQCNT